MGILDLNFRKKEAKPKPVFQDKNNYSSSVIFRPMPVSPLVAAMNGMMSTKNYARDPRLMIEMYKLLDYCFPHFRRASQVHVDFMGDPEPVSDDEGFQRELYSIFENFKMFNHGCLEVSDVGFGTFLKQRIFQSAMSPYGKSFNELIRDESGIIHGAISACAEHFDYRPDPVTNYYSLYYLGGSEPIKVYDVPDIINFTYNPTAGTMWGKPLQHGAEYFADKAIRLMEAKVSYEQRIGNPSSDTLISLDPDGTEELNPEDRKEIRDRMDAIVKAKTSALTETSITGKPADTFGALPAKTKIETIWQGAGVSGGNTEEATGMFVSGMVLCTDCPGEFMGLQIPGGIGGERFKIGKQFLQTRADNNRMRAKHVAYKILTNILISMKVNPKYLKQGGFDIHFNVPNLDDELVAAQTKQVDALAVQQQLNNYNSIRVMSEEAATEYAESINQSNWNWEYTPPELPASDLQ